MSELSIIEFVVFGFITYSSLLMLIISTIKEVPTGKSLSIVRAIYLIPGIICAGVLASSGENMATLTTSNTIRNLNTTEVWTETVAQSIPLQNPVWITIHVFILVVLVVYVISQMLILLTKKD